MDELFGIILLSWVTVATIGAVDNMLSQTPDKRIIKMCKEKGYLNVGQERVTCSIEKKDE